MAKEKPSKVRSKGQPSIRTFFSGKDIKKDEPKVAAADSESDNPSVANLEDVSDVESDGDAPIISKKVAKSSAPDESDLPPIYDIPTIFSDIVKRIPKIKDVAVHIAGRKLRVATMCSGTESPLLALELIQKSLSSEHGVEIDVEHVFSCEIEPFKQAYIERNFQPPLLFRDVCELGDGEAYVIFALIDQIQ